MGICASGVGDRPDFASVISNRGGGVCDGLIAWELPQHVDYWATWQQLFGIMQQQQRHLRWVGSVESDSASKLFDITNWQKAAFMKGWQHGK